VGPGYWVAPGVPRDSVPILRKAFELMTADQQFLADARQIKLDLLPKTGEQVQAAVSAVAQFPADVLAETGTILKW
jgi:hypothetical protein